MIDLNKQFRFALSKALNATAKLAQTATKKAIQSSFTIRGNWLNSAIGPKVLFATKDDLSAAVVMKGDFLNLQETGGIKLPSGRFLAVPTGNVRRTKRDIIARSNRPKNLRNTFIITGKSGRKLIAQRTGRGKKKTVKIMYVLIPQAEIDKTPTFTVAVPKTFEKEFSGVFFEELKRALATAKR